MEDEISFEKTWEGYKGFFERIISEQVDKKIESTLIKSEVPIN